MNRVSLISFVFASIFILGCQTTAQNQSEDVGISPSQSGAASQSAENPSLSSGQTIWAHSLEKAYEATPLEANAWFTDKVILVTGELLGVGLEPGGSARASISTVPCAIKKDDALGFSEVPRGALVTVKGRVIVGENATVSLEDCVFDSIGSLARVSLADEFSSLEYLQESSSGGSIPSHVADRIFSITGEVHATEISPDGRQLFVLEPEYENGRIACSYPLSTPHRTGWPDVLEVAPGQTVTIVTDFTRSTKGNTSAAIHPTGHMVMLRLCAIIDVSQ